MAKKKNYEIDDVDLISEVKKKVSEEDEDVRTSTGTATIRLNVREDDSGEANTPIVDVLNKGDHFIVFHVGCSPMFFKIKTASGKEGYVVRRFVILDVN